MDDVPTWLTAIAAALAAAAATASAVAARRANRTAKAMEAIERERRHEELTPEFELDLRRPSGSPVLYLVVRWVGCGPEEMRVTVRVLDEEGQDHRTAGPPRDVEPAAWDQFIWGPLELDPAASEQVQDRRTSRAFVLSRENGRTWERLQMRPTRPGPWMGDMTHDEWAADRGPLLLELVCESEKYRPWRLRRSLDLP